MSAPPYVPWYYGDYLRDTLDLNTTEHGAYMTLIGAAFSHGGTLPPDKEALYRFTFAKTNEQRRATDRVLARYWTQNADGSFSNKRLTLELEHAMAIHEAQSLAGKRSAAKRWGDRSAIRSPIETGDTSPRSSASSSVVKSAYGSPDSSASSSPVTTNPIHSIPKAPPPPLASDSSNPSPSSSSPERARARDVGGNGGEVEQVQGGKAPAGDGGGKVELTDQGEWLGIDDHQKLYWQGLYDNLSIPDALRDAGQWLVTHPDERQLYTQRAELKQYLIRWLIRESKPRPPSARH